MGDRPAVFREWAEARSGDLRSGEQRIRAALAEMDATGTSGFRPFAPGVLAEAQLLAGRPAEAGDTLRLATQEADRLGEHAYDRQLRALQARLEQAGPRSASTSWPNRSSRWAYVCAPGWRT
jgi:hypothetical protein